MPAVVPAGTLMVQSPPVKLSPAPRVRGKPLLYGVSSKVSGESTDDLSPFRKRSWVVVLVMVASNSHGRPKAY